MKNMIKVLVLAVAMITFNVLMPRRANDSV